MVQVNQAARETGWRAAVEQFFPAEAALISSDRLADFWHIWDLPPDPAILAIGDDWGTIATLLGRVASRVVVIETVPEQACFIGIRARQTKLPVETVCADFLRLPLAPGRFDAVFLNGIPKHSGMQAESKPWKAQVRLLRRGGL